MATIASLNIIFRGITGPLESATRSARKTLKGFQGSIFSLNGALAAIGAGVSLNALKNSIHDTMESIDRVAKVSDRIGITTEALLGLQHAAGLAGVETAMLDQSLTKMGNFLAEASNGGKAQSETLKRLGMSAKELAGIPLDQAFLKISDAILKLDSPAQRVSAAMDIFGKSGAELLPLLQQGSAGIAETAAEVDKLGASFSRIDAAQVEAANDAMTRVGVALGGIKNQIAIGISPFVESMAKKFTDWAASANSSGSSVITVMENVGKGVGVVADVVDVLHDGFQFLQAGVTKGIAFILDGLAFFARGLQEIANLIPGVDAKFGDFLGTLADEVHRAAAEEWEDAKKSFAAPPPSQAIQKYFDDIKANSRSAAVEVSKVQTAISAIKTPNILDSLKSGFADLKALAGDVARQFQQDMAEATKALTLDMQTPLEEFEKRMHELDALRLGGLDDKTFNRAKNKALVDLQESLPDTNRRAAALEFGTSAAFSAQLNKPRPTEKDILTEARKQTAIMEKQLDHFAKTGEVVFGIP